MHERPIGPLVDCLRAQGAVIEYAGSAGCLPLRVYGGGLRGGAAFLESSISSQFASSVLMVAPYCREPLRLTLSEETPTSLAYIHMTLRNMAQFGVSVSTTSLNVFDVPHAAYACRQYSVEPDASSATYAAALAAVAGVRVELSGLGTASTQGDARFASVLERMGCTVSQTEDVTVLQGVPPGGRLKVCVCVFFHPRAPARIVVRVALSPALAGCCRRWKWT